MMKVVGFLLKAAGIIAALAAISAAFDFYKAGFYLKGTVVFYVSVVVLMICTAFFDKTRENGVSFSGGEYKPLKPAAAVFKIMSIAALAALGQYFFMQYRGPEGTAAYLFAVIQVILLFPSKKSTGVVLEGEKNRAGELSGLSKIILGSAVLASVVLFYVSYRYLKVYSLKECLAYFIPALFIFGFAMNALSKRPGKSRKELPVYLDYLILAVITAAGFFLRVHELPEIPFGASFDEALSIHTVGRMNSGEKFGVFISSSPFQVSALYYYMLAGFLGFFRDFSIENARLMSAIAGTLNVVFMYFLVRKLFDRRAGLIASLLTAFSYIEIIYSRMAWLWIFVPVLAVMTFYFFYKAVQSRNTVFYALAGVTAGLNLYFYNAAKMVPFIFAVFILYLFIRNDTRSYIFRNWKGLFVFAASAFIVFIPLLSYIINHPDDYFARINMVRAFGIGPKMFEPGVVKFFTEHLVDLLVMFTTKSSGYGYYNFPYKPLLDTVSGFFFLVGCGWIFYTWKKKTSFFLLSWAVIALSAAFLSQHGDDPNTQRAILVFPAVIIIITIGIRKMWHAVSVLGGAAAKAVVPVLLAVLFMFAAVENIYTVFSLYKKDVEVKSAFFLEGKVVADDVIKNKEKNILMSPFFIEVMNMGIFLKNQPRKMIDPAKFEFSKFYNKDGKDVYFVTEGIYRHMEGLIKEYFPEAKVNINWNYDYSLMKKWRHYRFRDTTFPYATHVSIHIPYETIYDSFTMKASYYSAEGKFFGHGLIRENVIPNKPGADKIILESLIEIPVSGSYKFSCAGTGAAEFYFDGRKAGEEITLVKGLHKMKTVVTGLTSPVTGIMWEGPAAGGAVPPEYFINAENVYGLKGEYYVDGKKTDSMISHVMAFRNYYMMPRIRGAYSPVWKGYINIDKPGIYSFLLISSEIDSIVKVGGVQVYESRGHQNIHNDIYLKRGRHPIYVKRGPGGITNLVFSHISTIQLKYKTEDMGIYTVVPYYMLKPY